MIFLDCVHAIATDVARGPYFVDLEQTWAVFELIAVTVRIFSVSHKTDLYFFNLVCHVLFFQSVILTDLSQDNEKVNEVNNATSKYS